MKRIAKTAGAAMKRAQSELPVSCENDTARALPALRSDERRREIKTLIDRATMAGLLSAPEHDVLEAMAVEWERHLTRHGVPTEAFDTLYESAVELRIQDRNEKRSTGPFDIEDLCAPWDGMKSLFADRKHERSAEGCARCFGIGWEVPPKDATGYSPGAKRCNHQPLLEGAKPK